MSVVQKPWIRSYYVDLLEKSEKNNGNWEPDERLKQVRQYAKCFRELDKIAETDLCESICEQFSGGIQKVSRKR